MERSVSIRILEVIEGFAAFVHVGGEYFWLTMQTETTRDVQEYFFVQIRRLRKNRQIQACVAFFGESIKGCPAPASTSQEILFLHTS